MPSRPSCRHRFGTFHGGECRDAEIVGNRPDPGGVEVTGIGSHGNQNVALPGSTHIAGRLLAGGNHGDVLAGKDRRNAFEVGCGFKLHVHGNGMTMKDRRLQGSQRRNRSAVADNLSVVIHDALGDGSQTLLRLLPELRNHVESAFWYKAVQKLTEQDKQELQSLVARAWEKLRGTPIQVPHQEHRNLHLKIYSRLENPFVTGILEAYWEAYEAVGLNVFAGGYEYLQEVWKYHQEMVDAICNANFEAGYEALVKHTDLLYQRP